MKEKLLISTFAFLFTLFLVAAQMYYLTKHDVIGNTFTQILSQQYNLNELDVMIKYTCNVTDTLVLPVPGENLTISCSEVNNSTQLIQKIFDYFYFKQYDCGFFECYKLGEYNLLYYVSNEANQLYYKTAVGLLAASTFMAAIFIFISEDRKRAIGRIGISLMSIAIPLLIIFIATNYFTPIKMIGLEEFALKINLIVAVVGASLLGISKLKF